jgi:hypothetical protein
MTRVFSRCGCHHGAIQHAAIVAYDGCETNAIVPMTLYVEIYVTLSTFKKHVLASVAHIYAGRITYTHTCVEFVRTCTYVNLYVAIGAEV